MNWILFALIPPFLWAFANVLNKIIRTKQIESSSAYFIIASLFQVVCVIGLFFTWKDIPFSMTIVYAMLIGMMQALGGFIYFRALGIEEISRIIPFARFESIFVILFASVFMHEIFTPLRYAGFFLILLGGFIVAVKEFRGAFVFSHAFFLMLMASFLWGTADVLLKLLTNSVSYLPLFFLNRTGALLFAILLLFIPKFRKETVMHLKKITSRTSIMLVVSEGLSLFGLLIFFYAFSVAPISIVNVILGFQPLFVFIIASAVAHRLPNLLDEQLTRKAIFIKIAGIILLILGLFFIEYGLA
jgi:drug/metabolite transporter (DMT)-like permease